MPTPEEVVKAAQEQQAEAERKAQHPVTDLRELRTGLDPDAEAEGKGTVEPDADDGTDAPAHEADSSADVFDVSSAKKAELVAEAEKRGVDSSGTADELRERLGG